jgi:hypothetical protein
VFYPYVRVPCGWQFKYFMSTSYGCVDIDPDACLLFTLSRAVMRRRRMQLMGIPPHKTRHWAWRVPPLLLGKSWTLPNLQLKVALWTAISALYFVRLLL